MIIAIAARVHGSLGARCMQAWRRYGPRLLEGLGQVAASGELCPWTACGTRR